MADNEIRLKKRFSFHSRVVCVVGVGWGGVMVPTHPSPDRKYPTPHSRPGCTPSYSSAKKKKTFSLNFLNPFCLSFISLADPDGKALGSASLSSLGPIYFIFMHFFRKNGWRSHRHCILLICVNSFSSSPFCISI